MTTLAGILGIPVRLGSESMDGFSRNARPPSSESAVYFDQGELSERCRTALRDATEPVNVEDIARTAMVAKGIDPEDRRVRADFCKRLRWPLERMQASGSALKIRLGKAARWRLA